MLLFLLVDEDDDFIISCREWYTLNVSLEMTLWNVACGDATVKVHVYTVCFVTFELNPVVKGNRHSLKLIRTRLKI